MPGTYYAGGGTAVFSDTGAGVWGLEAALCSGCQASSLISKAGVCAALAVSVGGPGGDQGASLICNAGVADFAVAARTDPDRQTMDEKSSRLRTFIDLLFIIMTPLDRLSTRP